MGRKRSRTRTRKPTRKKHRATARGTIEINRAGYGFVKTAEGEFFIPRSKIDGAFDGDLVEVARSGGQRNSQGNRGFGTGSDLRPEGRVVRVVERAHATVVGRYEIAEPFGIVIPDDPRIPHDIFTRISDFPNIPDGSLVRVRITEFPTRRSAALGVVEEVLGSAEDPSLAVERVIARHKLETKFSEGAVAEAKAAKLDLQEAFSSGYRDIRDRFVFTIDPADAKDFDDALSVESVGSGLRLGVHIADVGHYVTWDCSIDIDARKRATSVYLVDRVIPMLPEELSNELCSLKPDEDRRCITVDIFLNDKFDLLEYEIYPAVMRSNARLSYDEALEMLESEKGSEDLLSRLKVASSIASAREHLRLQKGGLEFQTKEAKVRLDQDGKPFDIEVREKNRATTLIEEAMIFANEVVARHLDERRIPAAFRVHEPPEQTALDGLVPVLREFSWFTNSMAQALPSGNPHVIQKVLNAASGRAEAELVTMLLLRSMMRAVYSPYDQGHYGLGSDHYCHFTSPIRRYPDLIVHRALHSTFPSVKAPTKGQNAQLVSLCEHSSEMERVAELASRDSQESKIVEYMEQFIGEHYDAIVSGVTTYGIYVRLENCAEGLVPIRALGSEYFAFDPVRHLLKGSDTGKEYRLGERLEVVLKTADTERCQLDFALAKRK